MTVVVNPASPQLSQVVPPQQQVPRAPELQNQQLPAAGALSPNNVVQQNGPTERVIEPTKGSDSQALDGSHTSASGLHSPPWDMHTAVGDAPQSSSPPGWRRPDQYHQSEDLAEEIASGHFTS